MSITYIRFGLITVVVFLLASIGAPSLAGWYVGGESLRSSSAAAVSSLIAHPYFVLMLFAPFALIGLMAASLARARSMRAGNVLFASGTLPLLVLFCWGYLGSAQALRDHAWTASTLSIGLLPFISIPILIVVGIARLAADH